MRISDWSSDVCSSDLPAPGGKGGGGVRQYGCRSGLEAQAGVDCAQQRMQPLQRVARGCTHRLTREIGDRLVRRGERRGAEINCRRQRLRHPFHQRSEEHTSELQSLMRISYAVFCLKKKNKNTNQT